MRNSILCFILLTQCYIIHSQVSIKNCSELTKGTFKYARDTTIQYIINDDFHIEYHKNGLYFNKSKIRWISECQYKLVLEESTLPNFPYKTGSELNVTIHEFNGDTIIIEQKTGLESWKSEIIKTSNQTLPLYHRTFGKYHKISDYNVYFPCIENPYITPVHENEYTKVTSYTYTPSAESNDLNKLYSVEILDFKNNTSLNNDELLLEASLSIYNLTLKSAFDGKILEVEMTEYKGKNAYLHKASLNWEVFGDVYAYALAIPHNGVIIKMLVLTSTRNDSNSRIDEFFDSILFN